MKLIHEGAKSQKQTTLYSHKMNRVRLHLIETAQGEFTLDD